MGLDRPRAGMGHRPERAQAWASEGCRQSLAVPQTAVAFTAKCKDIACRRHQTGMEEGQMRFLAVSRQGAVIFILSALLAACTVVVDDGPRPRPPGPHPQLCTMQYQPVCARHGGDRQTFANACLAEREGYRIVRDGPCRDGGGGGGEQTFCTREDARSAPGATGKCAASRTHARPARRITASSATDSVEKQRGVGLNRRV